MPFAFQCGEIDVGEGHAAGSHKFFPEFAFAGEGIAVCGEGGREPVQPLGAQFRPAHVFAEAGALKEVLPQALLHRVHAGKELLRVLCCHFPELFPHRVLIGVQPVNDHGALVLAFRQIPGGMGGELERGRTAEPPVRDEKGPVGLERSARKAHGCLRNQPHEAAEGRVRHGEGEQGGDRGDHFQPQTLQERQSLAGAARGDYHVVKGFSAHEIPALIGHPDASHRSAEAELRAPHAAIQAADNVQGVLRAGEPAVVRLQHQRNALGLKPADGIFLGKGL